MTNSILTRVLLNLRHRLVLLGVVARQVLNLLVGRYEVDLIFLSDDFACKFGFVIFLADVARLVVKETVRVAHPCHTAEENSIRGH